jgi:hypothetical protein
MKKLLIPAVMLATMVFACQQDKEVSPTQASTLTTEEQRVADRVGSLVPMNTARSQIKAYHEEVGDVETRAVAFGKTTIDAILAQKGCVGIRAYFVKDRDGKKTLVLVGIDKDKKDIQNTTDPNARTTGGGGKAGGEGHPCPQHCE